VVPTSSIAAGLAVMVGYDAEGEPDVVVEEMLEICGSLRAAEVTVSVRDARIGDREVPEGAFIGFLAGELIAVEETLTGATLVLASKILGEGADFLTLLQGEDLSEDDLEAILEGIHELDEDLEVEVRDGGQPLYPVQMVAE
jgi:dihydroxyacetone kinase-like predicted kinase